MRSFTTMKDFDGAKKSINNSRYSRFPSKKQSQPSIDNATVRTPFSNVRSKLSMSQNTGRIVPKFNMSNPNPQPTDFVYKGARDIGYRKFFEGKNPLTEVVRFGKKVDYYNKMSNDELMR